MQTTHPLDDEVLDMHDTKRAMIRVFSRNGHIDEEERAVLDSFTAHKRNLSAYRFRDIAADAFRRNGLSKLTRRRFRDAGVNTIDLDAERRKHTSNVIEFHPRNRNHAG